MRVLMLASEMAPLAKTGGLGDVIAALPSALHGLGIEVTVLLPGYRQALRAGRAEPTGIRLAAPISGHAVEAELYRVAGPEGADVYLLRADPYFDRDALYGSASGDYADNAERFAFFGRAALAAVDRLGDFDVLHCHDWQTALAPVFLHADAARYPHLQRLRTALTIHNLGYQGIFWALDWHLLQLDWKYFSSAALEFHGQINYLKGGLVFADAITTVSPRYAQEICTPELGWGLDGVLQSRRHALVGILNGVDYRVWSPEADPRLAASYSRGNPSGKHLCKLALQRQLGLAEEPALPLLGVVSRLAAQKGVDLILEAAPALLAEPVQLAVLGSGEAAYESGLADLARRHPRQCAAHIGFDDGLAHRIEAGADIFLMPSRYEPCGLNQIYSLRYGTAPVVRATGGLDDTVGEFDEATGSGTGFKFGPYTGGALLSAVRRALEIYRRPASWARLVDNGMAADFSWERSARRYAELYRRLAPAAA